MDYTQVIQVAGSIIVAFGGASGIILGFSRWFGKLWANKILEEEKHNYAVEIEKYKNDLISQLNILNASIDNSTFVTKMQYEKEFSIYLEIWEKLSECVISTKSLFPNYENRPADKYEFEKFQQRKWEKFVTHFNEYSNTITKYSPFYEKYLHDDFKSLRQLCNAQGNKFNLYEINNNDISHSNIKEMSSEEKREIYADFPKKINEIQDALQIDIRDHLKSLQAIN